MTNCMKIIKSSIGDLVIKDISHNPDDWITIKSDAVSWDRNDFIVKLFIKDFPSIGVLGTTSLEKFNFINEICTRSKAMRDWYITASIAYSTTTQLPLHLKDSLTGEEFLNIQSKINKLNKGVKLIINKREQAARDYKEALRKLDNEEELLTRSLVKDDVVMKILLLDTQSLPLSLQALIAGYTPNDKSLDVAESKRGYAKEMLIRFQMTLIESFKDRPIEEFDRVMDEISIK